MPEKPPREKINSSPEFRLLKPTEITPDAKFVLKKVTINGCAQIVLAIGGRYENHEIIDTNTAKALNSDGNQESEELNEIGGGFIEIDSGNLTFYGSSKYCGNYNSNLLTPEVLEKIKTDLNVTNILLK